MRERTLIRFRNFKKAYENIKASKDVILKNLDGNYINIDQDEKDIDLKKIFVESFIHRFEIISELAWKLLKDYMQDQGINLKENTPKSIIREGFSSKILDEEKTQLFLSCIDFRNESSHRYDEKILDQFVVKSKIYMPLFEYLFEFFKKEYEENK